MDTKMKISPKYKTEDKVALELLVILAICPAVFIFASKYNLLEIIVGYSQRHEDWQVDEMIVVFIFLAISLAVFSGRRWKEAKEANNLLLQSNKELQKALSEIKQLKGMIPICVSCKNIRDDEGFWDQVESYLRKRSDVEFTHSICPKCMQVLYPEFVEKQD